MLKILKENKIVARFLLSTKSKEVRFDYLWISF